MALDRFGLTLGAHRWSRAEYPLRRRRGRRAVASLNKVTQRLEVNPPISRSMISFTKN